MQTSKNSSAHKSGNAPRKLRVFAGVTSALLAAMLAACAAPGPAPVAAGNVYPSTYPATYPATTYPTAPVATYPSQYPPANTAAYVEYGRVTNVEVISTQEQGRGTGLGAVLGAVAGGVIGNQVGGGGGRDVARVAGIVGGGFAGNAIEKNARTQTHDTYRISVQTDNGATRAYDMAVGTDLRPGDRVRIENNTLYRI